MIAAPRGWTLRPGTSGWILTCDQDPSSGLMAYRERVHPLRALDVLVARHVASLPYRCLGAETETLVTDEGEAAAFVELDLADGDVRLRGALGLVLLDDSYAELSALIFERGCAESILRAARAMTLTDRHGVAQRPRLYAHDLPVGWDRVQRGSDNVVAYAKGGAEMLLLPAVPLSRAPDLGAAGEPVSTAWGEGRLLVRADGDVAAVEVRVCDRAWCYRLAASAPRGGLDAVRSALLALLSSMRPLPRPPRALHGSALGHWAE